jgi:signal transduction histidine kinase/DNA-binding NarL/FixJ family response regulator/HAMP domain-containing protein
MGRKILLSFLALLAAAALGGLPAALYVTRATEELENVLGMHKVEGLRSALIIEVQGVQADLHALHTPRSRDLDAIVHNVLRLERTAAHCRSCHHGPETLRRLDAMEDLIEHYQEALSYFITARANRERMQGLQLAAASIGDQILAVGEEMAREASRRLDLTTRAATERIHRVKPVIAATGAAVLLLGLLAALHLTRSVTRPVRRLVEATRVLASGEVGHTVSAEGTPEFAELANHFNAMSTALRDQYERLQEANVELEAEIAERRRTEEALRLDESRLRALLDLSRMADAPAGRIAEFVLDRALELTGSAAGFVALVEDRGRRFTACAHRAPPREDSPFPDPCRDEPTRHDAPWAAAVRSRAPTFRAGPHPLLAVPLLDQERLAGLAVMVGKGKEYGEDDAHHLGLLLHGLWQHVGRRKAEEELLRAQKLESVGLLAGGIAHDFNNLLTGILANASLAQASLHDGASVRARLQEVEKASLRAQALTQQLLTFSRGGAPVRKTIRLGELVREAASFALSGASVRCEFALPDDLWPAPVDAGQIGQVVANLVINAAQAMEAGGTVTVSGENVEAGAVGGPPGAPGRHVCISVRDEGCGIPPDDLERIFDPYFTTKPGGTGLGLATAYSVVRRHGGHLAVSSRPGAGSTFRVYLPAAHPSAPAAEGAEPSPGRSPPPPPLPRRRVLVMDDEAMIREVAAEILLAAGYEVETAAAGEQAVAAYARARDTGNPFAAVVLDLTVPGKMGGLETLERLRELDPDVRGVVSSGYSNDPAMAEHERYGFRARVRKPYRMAELLAALEEALRTAPPSAPPPAKEDPSPRKKPGLHKLHPSDS